mmetsp:Transcript_3523/g.10236  ORF Transcript_3523/g.10236 Transcript_3523/m.10236 type:complete len:335 (-) Transcript_3523:124-1128(-)
MSYYRSQDALDADSQCRLRSFPGVEKRLVLLAGDGHGTAEHAVLHRDGIRLAEPAHGHGAEHAVRPRRERQLVPVVERALQFRLVVRESSALHGGRHQPAHHRVLDHGVLDVEHLPPLLLVHARFSHVIVLRSLATTNDQVLRLILAKYEHVADAQLEELEQRAHALQNVHPRIVIHPVSESKGVRFSKDVHDGNKTSLRVVDGRKLLLGDRLGDDNPPAPRGVRLGKRLLEHDGSLGDFHALLRHIGRERQDGLVGRGDDARHFEGDGLHLVGSRCASPNLWLDFFSIPVILFDVLFSHRLHGSVVSCSCPRTLEFGEFLERQFSVLPLAGIQ